MSILTEGQTKELQSTSEKDKVSYRAYLLLKSFTPSQFSMKPVQGLVIFFGVEN